MDSFSCIGASNRLCKWLPSELVNVLTAVTFPEPNATSRSMVLLIDNYDSFVFNLSRYIEELGVATHVVRNDAISVPEIQDMHPAAIVLSPGPCAPAEAGICCQVVQSLYQEIPILGVCLGHQAIGEALGARIVRSPQPMHGRTSEIVHGDSPLFAGCPNPLTVARYHSLVVDEATLPESLKVTARTHDGLMMAMEHRTERVFGVQFHPESILTRYGHQILHNFLQLSGVATRSDWLSEEQQAESSLETSADFYQRQFDLNAFRPL